MPFTNVQTASGPGNLRFTYGDWTFTQTAASETIDVGGGRVYGAFFVSQDSTGALMIVPVRYSVSTSGAITTITVYGQEGVTTGQFLIVHK